jgi:hypothetical protein
MENNRALILASAVLILLVVSLLADSWRSWVSYSAGKKLYFGLVTGLLLLGMLYAFGVVTDSQFEWLQSFIWLNTLDVIRQVDGYQRSHAWLGYAIIGLAPFLLLFGRGTEP